MSAPAQAVAAERTDARSAVLHGLLIGLLTALVVIVFVKGGELIGDAAVPWFGAVVVFTTGCLVAFLPARWVGARTGDGIAAAALLGLVGTASFSLIDIIALRPLSLYPWTWDAVGGSSGWWYLPVWWILGTFVAWMGAIVTAGEVARGRGRLGGLLLGTLVGTAAVTLVGVFVTPLGLGPVLVGGAFVIAVVAWAVLHLLRWDA
jgi:hypothetical protein